MELWQSQSEITRTKLRFQQDPQRGHYWRCFKKIIMNRCRCEYIWYNLKLHQEPVFGIGGLKVVFLLVAMLQVHMDTLRGHWLSDWSRSFSVPVYNYDHIASVLVRVELHSIVTHLLDIRLSFRKYAQLHKYNCVDCCLGGHCSIVVQLQPCSPRTKWRVFSGSEVIETCWQEPNWSVLQ